MKRKNILTNLFANWPAKIISLAAAVILFMFYRINAMEERFFSVPVLVNLPPGLAVANPYPRSVKITLRGDADDIFPIPEEDIEVAADFGRYSSEGKYRVPLRIVRKGSALNIEPLVVKAEPSSISIILEHKLEKSLEVVPVIKGTPAHGYEMVQYTLTPRVVEISGPKSQVQKIDSLITEEINLTGRTEDFFDRVRIKLENPLIQFPGGASVVIRGIIREAEIIKTFEPIDIISIDLSPYLQLSEPLPEGSIKIQGTQNAIESLTPDQLRLVVDCIDITQPGDYTLYPEADIPLGYVILKYEPRELILTFLPSAREEER